MAKYTLKHRSFINGRLHEAGEVIHYDGEAGSNLIPDGVPVEKQEVMDVDAQNELTKLREEYEELFGKKPHANAGIESLKAKIAEKRTEMSV